MSNYTISYLIELKDRYTIVAKGIALANKGMKAGFDHLKRSVGEFDAKMKQAKVQCETLKNIGQKMFVGMAIPITALGFAMIKLASDANETNNKIDVIYGKSSYMVKNWANKSITGMGMSKQSALDSVALYSDMATGMGVSREKSMKLSTSLTQLGADMASFKNIPIGEAQTALASIFTGETETLKRLGVVMTQNNLQQYASTLGIHKKIEKMKESDKIMLRYRYVMDQTRNSHGDFNRTLSGTANQMRMFGENSKNVGAIYGAYLLPLFTPIVQLLNKAMIGFTSLSGETKKAILVFGAFLVILSAVALVAGTIAVALATIEAPVLASIVAVAQVMAILVALGAVMSILWFKSAKFRSVMQAIGSILRFVGLCVMAVFKAIWKFLNLPVVKWGILFAVVLTNLCNPIMWIIAGFVGLYKIIKLVIAKLGGLKKVADGLKGFFDKLSKGVGEYVFKTESTTKSESTIDAKDVKTSHSSKVDINVKAEKGSQVTSTKVKSKGTGNAKVGINRAGGGK